VSIASPVSKSGENKTMYNFALQTIFLISIGVIVYLAAIAVPRVNDENVHERKGFIREWFRNVPLDKIDDGVNSFSEKTLRRLKILTMKFDNIVGRSLNKVKKNGNGNGNGNGNSLLSDSK